MGTPTTQMIGQLMGQSIAQSIGNTGVHPASSFSNAMNQKHIYLNQQASLQQMYKPIDPQNLLKQALKPIIDGTATENDYDQLMPLFTYDDEYWSEELPANWDMFDHTFYDEWSAWSTDIIYTTVFDDMRVVEVNGQPTALDGNRIVKFNNQEDHSVWMAIKKINGE